MSITLTHYLILGSILFAIGLYGMMKRKNIILILLSSEIMLNAINVALIGIGYHIGNIEGQIVALFILAIAASEVAVGLGLVIAWYKKYKSLDIDSIANLRG